MGIKGLSMLLQTHAPAAVREVTMEDLFGRKVAMDASMSIYQFMVAVRTASGSGGAEAMLMNEHGEVTSHLQGIFYRTIRMLENGLKPVFVFDGKPPTLKSDELQRRSTRREETSTQLEQATEEANQEDINKFSRRMVKVTKEHNEECRKLLQLMGIPVVQASGEAEAQCAALAKAGKVWATGTEDMDALTFGSPVLLRHLTFSAARKIPINEFHLDKALEGLGLTMDQFVDLCMLSGCDYLSPIRGIAGGKALQLLKKHGSLEKVLTNLDRKKYPYVLSLLVNELLVFQNRIPLTKFESFSTNLMLWIQQQSKFIYSSL
jgi:flap endonuclease-1